MPKPIVANQPPEASASSAIEPLTTKQALVARIRSLSERIVRWGAESDFVKLLELVGKFGLVIAAASYLLQIPAQRQAREDALKAKRYQAWALINSAKGSAADGGRRDALQDLNGDVVSLNGADLAKAFLSSIKLPRAKLNDANLNGADLNGADLTQASLHWANLRWVDLTDAHLFGASLNDANLTNANLNGADLTNANLTEADLNHANLTKANLNDANLNGADLNDANLTNATLTRTDLTGAKIDQKQLDGACGSNAKLSPGLTLKPCPPKSSP